MYLAEDSTVLIWLAFIPFSSRAEPAPSGLYSFRRLCRRAAAWGKRCLRKAALPAASHLPSARRTRALTPQESDGQGALWTHLEAADALIHVNPSALQHHSNLEKHSQCWRVDFKNICNSCYGLFLSILSAQALSAVNARRTSKWILQNFLYSVHFK